MPYVITDLCSDTKDRACVSVCPVNCIYEDDAQLYIHPDECIDCGACEPECPVSAIFSDDTVPPERETSARLNREIFESATPPGPPRQ